MKRREFLEKTLAGTAGLTIGVSGILSKSCKGANNKVVLALIGAGHRGVSSVTGACLNNPDVEIKTVCDVDDSVAGKAAKEIGSRLGSSLRTCRNMKEIFDDSDIDAVWIATPDHWHALATIRACQAGKHVFVEQMPGNCIWESRKVAEAATRYRRTVQVGYQYRSASSALSARDYIQSGKLGQVVHLKVYNLHGGTKWVGLPDNDIPAGLDWDQWLGPAPLRTYNPGAHKTWPYYWAYGAGSFKEAGHQLDIARMLMGDPGHPVSVTGWGGNHVWRSDRETPEFQSVTYDFEKFTITCESGCVTDYTDITGPEIKKDVVKDWSLNGTRIEIYGTEGIMYFGRRGWLVYGPGEEIMAHETGHDPDREHRTNFIQAIRERRVHPNSDPEQAHRSATLVHLANIAYRTGNRQVFFGKDEERIMNSNDGDKLLRSNYRNDFMIPEKV
jgi:predicted dehydrogenase